MKLKRRAELRKLFKELRKNWRTSEGKAIVFNKSGDWKITDNPIGDSGDRFEWGVDDLLWDLAFDKNEGIPLDKAITKEFKRIEQKANENFSLIRF